ncbi:hypothetical protein IAD21_02559 [Abditibacteriota bacterium]|nr:hypothetical protein IAD21_02559 [Abditibacteriota bacterium]
MNLRFKRWPSKVVAFTLPLGALIGSCSALAAPKLIMNGKTASTDVKVVGGSAYVKVADVAKALGMVVIKRGDSYEIKKPGGANPIKGVTQGKVGDVLFDGQWRFQVLNVQMPESFTMKTPADYSDTAGLTQFNPTTRTFHASQGYKLVVLQCRVTNAVNEKRTLWTAISDNRIHTALTDMEGGSHSPIAYDFEGGPIQSKWLVPGAILNFPVVFSVPQATQLKDLIFTLKNNQTDAKPNDVRVSLK